MKNIKRYTDPTISEKELETLSGDLIQAKLYHEKKKSWAALLEKKQGIKRMPPFLKVVSHNTSRRWWLVAAALLPLVCALLFWQKSQTVYQMAEQFFLAEEMPSPQTRKGGNNTSTWQAEANQFFSEGKFEQAILYFEKMEKEKPLTAENRFFKGLSYFQIGQADKAIADFLLVKSMEAKQPKFQKETSWFLALAYARRKDFKKAVTELEQVVQDGWKATEANELLEQIRKEQNK